MNVTNGQLPITHTFEPGDGWQYSVLLSELPHVGFMGGGSPDDYVVVTAWIPGDTCGRTYVMAKHGILTTHYVAEKFGQDVTEPIIEQVAEAIRQALGRPCLEYPYGDPPNLVMKDIAEKIQEGMTHTEAMNSPHGVT